MNALYTSLSNGNIHVISFLHVNQLKDRINTCLFTRIDMCISSLIYTFNLHCASLQK